jgi:A/G-specific adenine glycosylase
MANGSAPCEADAPGRSAGTLHPVPARIDPRTRRRVRDALLTWYAAGHRDFPWRATSDPYAVLVSEVMLQQTQASRVTARFARFMDRFPTAASLAAAPSADVLAEWSGLGYNRRALALQRAAATVSRAGWPRDVAGLAALPGVGPYTARAVASLAFDVPAGVVDTNVRRWLLRRFGGPDEPGRLQQVADTLAAPGLGAEVAAWTHATMEFGAGVCRSRHPRCNACPIAGGCPSRGAAGVVPVPRQAALRGSDRAYRGAILSLLSAARRHALDERALRAGLAADVGRIGSVLDERGWDRVVAALERDGLVHRSRGAVRLGLATIGA